MGQSLHPWSTKVRRALAASARQCGASSASDLRWWTWPAAQPGRRACLAGRASAQHAQYAAAAVDWAACSTRPPCMLGRTAVCRVDAASASPVRPNKLCVARGRMPHTAKRTWCGWHGKHEGERTAVAAAKRTPTAAGVRKERLPAKAPRRRSPKDCVHFLVGSSSH